MKTNLWVAGTAVALLALSGSARAGADGPPAPPAEALQACASIQVGAACSFTSQDGHQVSGTWCSGAQAEASCSFTLPDGFQVSGTCRAGPDGAALACAPSQPPQQR